MGFFGSTKNVLSDLMHRPQGELLREGMASYTDPFRKVLSGEARRKGILSFLGESSNAAVSALFGVPIALKAIEPDRPDLDSAGPMESLGKRWGQLWGGLAPNSPALYGKYGILPSIAAGVIASPIAMGLGKYTGRLADYVAGARPNPSEMYERFNKRMMGEIADLKSHAPDIDDSSAQQLAVRQFLAKNPDYDLDFLQPK